MGADDQNIAVGIMAADRVQRDDDLPPPVLQDFLDAVAAGAAAVPVGHVYRFEQIVEAHRHRAEPGQPQARRHDMGWLPTEGGAK